MRCISFHNSVYSHRDNCEESFEIKEYLMYFNFQVWLMSLFFPFKFIERCHRLVQRQYPQHSIGFSQQPSQTSTARVSISQRVSLNFDSIYGNSLLPRTFTIPYYVLCFYFPLSFSNKLSNISLRRVPASEISQSLQRHSNIKIAAKYMGDFLFLGKSY